MKKPKRNKQKLLSVSEILKLPSKQRQREMKKRLSRLAKEEKKIDAKPSWKKRWEIMHRPFSKTQAV